MTSAHVATSMATLNSLATATAVPIGASAGSGPVSFSRAQFDADLAAARKAGTEAERTRISAILNHEAAAGRGKLAAHLAFKTSMSVDDAAGMLAASATEGSFYAAGTGATGAGAEAIDWSEIVAGVNATLPGAQGEGSTP